MAYPAQDVADIFRDLGIAWRRANARHVSRGQLKALRSSRGATKAALGRPLKLRSGRGPIRACRNAAKAHIALWKRNGQTSLLQRELALLGQGATHGPIL
jgi:hypothetical protein